MKRCKNRKRNDIGNVRFCMSYFWFNCKSHIPKVGIKLNLEAIYLLKQLSIWGVDQKYGWRVLRSTQINITRLSKLVCLFFAGTCIQFVNTLIRIDSCDSYQGQQIPCFGPLYQIFFDSHAFIRETLVCVKLVYQHQYQYQYGFILFYFCFFYFLPRNDTRTTKTADRNSEEETRTTSGNPSK